MNMKVINSNKVYDFELPIKKSVPNAIAENPKLGEKMSFGCLRGVCGKCAIKVNKGIETLNPKQQVEEMSLSILGLQGKNYRLLCQCSRMVAGNVLIESIG